MVRNAVALFAFLSCAWAETPLVPTIDQSLSMKSAAGAQISPDGRYVAYVVQQSNWEENEFVQQIWVAQTATGESYQLTTGKKSSNSPRWSPDSRRIGFLSDRDGKRQIYLISPGGGEAAQLTTEENGVGSISWSPDGTAIAFLSSGADSKAKKDRKEKFGDFEVVGGDYTMNHLWLVKAPSEVPSDTKQLAKAEPLTQGEQFSVDDFSWSPDGKRIAFSATRDPDLGSRDTEQLYVIDLADRHVRKLLDGGGPNSRPQWSPDGKQIAFVTANGEQFYYYMNSRIAAVPAEGGTTRVLTDGFDEDANLIDWGPDGIYFSATRKPTPMSSASTREPVRSIEWILRTAIGCRTLPSRRTTRPWPASAPSPNHFAEVLLTPTGEFKPRYLTDLSGQWKQFSLARREVIQWKSSDGAPIEGVLIKPADYDPSRKYPLLVVIHGGPTGVDNAVLSADRTYPVERFVAKGALVLRPNYRGSAGLWREISLAQRPQPRRRRL